MRQRQPGSMVHRLLALSLLWFVVILVPNSIATPDLGSTAVEIVRGGVIKLQDAVNARRSVNIATKSVPPNGIIENAVGRTIEDFQLEDFVLLATLDGRLSARDRLTGIERWSMTTNEPSIQSVYHKKSLMEPKDVNSSGIPSIHEDENITWMVSPTENGELYFYSPDGNGLQRLGVTLKDIVHNMPYRPPGFDTVYNGSKNTTMFAINAKTGEIVRSFSPMGDTVLNMCTSNPDMGPGDNSCDSPDADPSQIVMIGLTEYIISIQNYRTGDLLWTIRYKEWTPNNSDMDLRLQHSRPKDNRFIYSRHDGFVFGFEELEGGNGRPKEVIHKFNVDLSSPVVRVFDVVKYTGPESTFDANDLLVLPQPGIPRPGDSRTDRTFVGFTNEGTCFAMSEEDFPFITSHASDAKCYERTESWEELPESERRKLLVGVHYTHGREKNSRTKPRLLGLPGHEGNVGIERKESSSPSPEVHSPLPISESVWDSSYYHRVLTTIGALFFCAIFFISKGSGLEGSQQQLGSLGQGLTGSVSDLVGGAPQPSAAVVDKPLPELPSELSPDADVLEDPPIGENPESSPTDVSENLPLPVVPLDELSALSNPESQTVLISVENPSTEAPAPIEAPEETEVEALLNTNVETIPVEPKTPIVRFAEAPVILGALKNDTEVAGPEEDVLPPVDVMDNNTAYDTPPTPEAKKKRKRGSRGKGKKNRLAANREEASAEASNNAKEETVTQDVHPQEAMEPIAQDTAEVASQSSIKTIIISDGQPGKSFVLSKLDVDDQAIIGHGSNGTVVFRGRWEDKPVAVKRIQTTHAAIAEKEVKMLQDTDYHPNIVRYHCRQQHAEFLYIALELCPGSLQDWVCNKSKFSESMIQHSNMRDTLLQCLRGLHHLHELKIVHRDIKPLNILVGYPKGKDLRPRFLISDFGLCRKLQLDEYSFGATTNGAQPSGTVGWRARELLTDITGTSSPFFGTSSQDTESASNMDIVVDPFTKRRATRAIDIFAMGCVFYFVLTGGQHPFGDRMVREYNIVQGAFSLAGLSKFADEDAQAYEAADLITQMIHMDHKQRPDTAKAGAHPLFWNDEKRLEFLCNVSDRFEMEEQKEKADIKAKCRSPYKSPYIPILEEHALPVVRGDGWLAHLDEHLSRELSMNKRRGYDGGKLLHLLRMIRNKSHHFADMDPAARAAVGEPPDQFMSYFTKRFPHLVLEVHRAIVKCELDKEKRFEKFFAHPFAPTI
ncbi:hypothetical protein EX30DRAFT_369885 [Ascodesmis nigricans]|uniref:non-specific serine/threonine protein kinase n=1 Tax=Ascodesmis nigricans TaxID=341454 RepID=A0A4S2N1G3_9PEZI|nr:hypothetical protein EX30DRAFT_369885 [Ascodesmis nigricans]